MCGIAGIALFDPSETVDPLQLRSMTDAIRHRGPDDEGQYIDGPVGLGSRRLSIVDVSGGHMPLTNEDGSLWIVFNGEIYNHPQLKPQLERRGHRYRTRSDTETVLHLYEDEGDRCVESLQGMFAFALWDSRRRRLLLARDRLGIKPLYFALTGGALIFGSEIKALLASGRVPVRFNDAVLPEFLATRFVAGEETFFRDVRKLRPGRTLSWSPGQPLRERQYWTLPDVPAESHAPRRLADAAAELQVRLRRAVQSHLMSDVPLGVFLSGGLDSSGLAALMAPLVRPPLRTFAVGFEEAEANELGYARLVARAINAEHHEVVVGPAQFFEALPRLVWHEDEPIAFPSSVPLYFVSRLARDHVKVVLTGEGADELFLGYNRYRVAAWNARLGGIYAALAPRAVRSLVRGGVRDLPRGLRRYAERSFLALDADARGLFYENFAVFPPSQQRALLNGRARPELDPFRAVLRHYDTAGGTMLDRMCRADLQTYLVELLMKQDQMSMAASIESRVPFLDHELVEHVVGLPPQHKLRGWQTKAVLREALHDLVPREILTRRKMGFPTPIGNWLRTSFAHVADDLLLSDRFRDRGYFAPAAVERLVREHRAGANHGDRLWLLITLELWQRIFVDGEPHGALAPAYACASSG